jgi:hypothetical protein
VGFTSPLGASLSKAQDHYADKENGMKNCHASRNQIMRRLRLITCAMALMAMLPQPVLASKLKPPPVPDNIRVPAGHKAYLVGYAVGTQNYICLPSGSGFAWGFIGPQATLFRDDDEQVITHFLSPNPEENGMPRATWQHSKDTSAVWAVAIASSTDPAFVEPGAIPWLLLQVVGAEDGPTGGDKLSETTFIQRLDTSGGVAPSTGCALATDVGKRAFVPYTTDYFFYKNA